MLDNKIRNGQFYTRGNPFVLPRFQQWIHDLDYNEDTPIIEPFSGANHIIKSMKDAGFSFNNWSCFDIEPENIEENMCPEFVPVYNDSILRYPQGFPLCITNPPYLAKNSAKRKGYAIDFSVFADLYQVSLQQMLENSDHIAAIIPESFITSKASSTLKQRCSTIISLTSVMFDDTTHPVCLALFEKEKTSDIDIYLEDVFLGKLSALHKASEKLLNNVDDDTTKREKDSVRIEFNAPYGNISFQGVDNTTSPSIYFNQGDNVDPKKVKHSSRSITRINVSSPLQALDIQRLITDANTIIDDYREVTQDVLMTSFKGVRKDGKYRRRLDFSTARKILLCAAHYQNHGS